MWESGSHTRELRVFCMPYPNPIGLSFATLSRPNTGANSNRIDVWVQQHATHKGGLAEATATIRSQPTVLNTTRPSTTCFEACPYNGSQCWGPSAQQTPATDADTTAMMGCKCTNSWRLHTAATMRLRCHLATCCVQCNRTPMADEPHAPAHAT